MTVASCLPKDWFTEIQLPGERERERERERGENVYDMIRSTCSLHDHSRSEVKVLLNNTQQFFGRLLPSAVCVNVDRDRLSYTNGIRDL